MAYYIMMGDNFIYHPLNPKYSCRSASATWGVNEIESLTFTVEYDHPLINEMDILRNDIQLNYGDNTQLALGRYRIIKKTLNWDKSLTVECEGMLAVLNDTVIAPYNFNDYSANCVKNFLTMFVNNHNAQVGNGTSSTLYVGDVTVTDSNNYVGRITETFKTTWEAIKESLIGSQLGGHIRARYYGNQGIYIDYLADFEESSQSIDFGVNLLDLTDEFDASEFYTAIYPVGKEGLTIKSYPDYSSGGYTKEGSIIKKDSLVDTYGVIVSKQEWSDVSLATNLHQKARALLGNSLPIDSITVSALDLHLLDNEMDALEVGTKVAMYSLPHGIDTVLELSSKAIDVLNPASSTLTLGKQVKTLTSTLTDVSMKEISYTPAEKRLPDGFTELTHIESTGTQYIDSGIKATQSAAELVLQFTKASGNQGVFGARATTTAQPTSYNLFYGVSANMIRLDWQGGTASNHRANLNDVMTIKLDVSGDVNVNGTNYNKIATKQACNYNLFVGNFNNIGSPYSLSGTVSGVSAKWQSVKIYSYGGLARNFVPARRDADGVIGLYDLIDNQFFTNSGTGTFIAGDEV